MDFMKVFDQTVRELKREVNLKVLKVPEMEQKVLDATDNEPWGPHGSALAEIAQATKRFSECQLVMNVLWTRLSETGRDWRHVYKSLAVIEYLVANGSESAVTDIIEHTFKISSLSSFEYVEPNGKDMGINVRKKVETIVALLNDKDKIQEVRNKASANRDKYVGLSSSGIAFKSSSASQSSSSFSSEGYGGFGGARGGDIFKDNNKDTEQFGEEKFEKYTPAKSRQGKTLKKGSTGHGSKDQDTLSSEVSKPSIPPQSANLSSISHDEDFDDFDPRGTSSSKPAAGSSSQVDLFGQSLVDDLLDLPTSLPTQTPAMSSNSSEVDLFADADFVSAPPHEEAAVSSQTQPQPQVDLFASKPAFPPAFSSPVDFFAAPDPVPQHETKTPDPINSSVVDPFAAVPLNSFDGSDPFGSFTSHTDPLSTEPNLNSLNGKSLGEFNAPPKKNTFQVKSGIWADSLSRGLIDLNISAPKKVSLTEVGIVGGLSDGSEEKEKAPSTAAYMGRAMGAGSGLGRSGISSSTSIDSDGDDFFSTLGTKQHQFGGFQK